MGRTGKHKQTCCYGVALIDIGLASAKVCAVVVLPTHFSAAFHLT